MTLRQAQTKPYRLFDYMGILAIWTSKKWGGISRCFFLMEGQTWYPYNFFLTYEVPFSLPDIV